MFRKILITLLLAISLTSCSKKGKPEYNLNSQIDPYKVYQEAIIAFEKGDYFFAEKKFINGVPINRTTAIDVNIARPVRTVKYLKTFRNVY